MNLGFRDVFLFILALLISGPRIAGSRTPDRALYERVQAASNEFKAQIESEINSIETGVKTESCLPFMRL